MIDKEQIKSGIAEEMGNSLKARFILNDESINLHDVIEEAVYCLAVNYVIIGRKIPSTSPDLLIAPFLEGIFMKVEQYFPNDFKQSHRNLVFERFEKLKENPHFEEIINLHYDGLYGSDGGNVI